MELESRVSRIFARAERELAELVTDAVARHDFAAVAQLAGIIQRLRTFAVQSAGSGHAAEGSAVTPSSPLNATTAMTRSPASAADAGGDPTTWIAAKVAPRKRIVGGHSYPQFRQEPDETLVKIGYSKSNRKRYEHRAPRVVLERLAAELAGLGAEGQLFSTDQLFDPPTPSLSDFPTYQVYLCLAFLVHHGLVLKMGRQGYTISAEAKPDFAAAVRAAFATLPAR